MKTVEEFKKEYQIVISKLLNSKIFLAFGLHLINFECVFISQKDIPPEMKKVNAPAYTDFEKIYVVYDSSFFDDDKSFLFTLIFTMLHEDMHMIFMHDKRISSRDREVWWMACDHVINLLVFNLVKESKKIEERLIIEPRHNIKEEVLCDEDFSNMIEEEVYEKLLKDGSYKKTSTSVKLNDFYSSVGLPIKNELEDETIEITTTSYNIGGKEKKTCQVSFPKVSDAQREKTLNDQRSLARSVFQNNVLSRGLDSHFLTMLLKRLFDVKVDWKPILADTIMVELQKSCDLIWGMPRMAWLANPSLPYLTNYDTEAVLGTVIFLLDESGSMSNRNVQEAFEIVLQSRQYFKNIYVIKHDYVKSWTKLYEDLTEDDIHELIQRRSCGGTSHKDAFEECVRFMKANPDTPVSLIIAVTDLMSDIQTTQDILPSNIPRVYLTKNMEYSKGIIGKIIEVQSE